MHSTSGCAKKEQDQTPPIVLVVESGVPRAQDCIAMARGGGRALERRAYCSKAPEPA